MDFPELRMTRVHLSNSENIEDINSGREGHAWSKAEDAEVKMSGLGINLAWCTCPVHHYCPHVHRCIIIDHQLFPNCTEGREEIEKSLMQPPCVCVCILLWLCVCVFVCVFVRLSWHLVQIDMMATKRHQEERKSL